MGDFFDVHLGGEEAVSIADAAHRVNAVVDCGAGAFVRVAGRPEPGPARVRYAPDVSAIRRDLGLSEPIPLDDAIARTVARHGTRRNP